MVCDNEASVVHVDGASVTDSDRALESRACVGNTVEESSPFYKHIGCSSISTRQQDTFILCSYVSRYYEKGKLGVDYII